MRQIYSKKINKVKKLRKIDANTYKNTKMNTIGILNDEFETINIPNNIQTY